MNIFGIFGKNEDWQIRFISNAICKAMFGLPVTLRQNRKFSYLYIDDLMPVLEFFIENDVKHKSYNVVPDQSVELADIANLIKKITSSNVEINIANAGLGLDYTGNNERLKSEMRRLKFTSIQDSAAELYRYYKKNINIIKKELLLEDK